MAKRLTTKTNLEIIGTARNPNIFDLKERGLVGLPDPGPEVAIRRAEFESEQAELNARVESHEGEIPLSFLRTNIETQESDIDAVGLNWEENESIKSEEVKVGHIRVEEKIFNVAGSVGMSNLPDSPVANEACGCENAVRVLRDRNPIQLHPYAVEREMYRQMIATGRVKAPGERA